MTETRPKHVPIKTPIVWSNIIILGIAHLIALQGIYYILTLQAQWKTILWSFLLLNLANLGVTAGAHRLWSHRSYKAKMPLQIFLATLHSLAFQNDVYTWARNHRVHHKYSDTDGDPHNIQRGFFFSHMGWLFLRKHPTCIEKSQTLDMTDLKTNPVLKFQTKYYYVFSPILAFVLPTLIPGLCWGESYWTSYTLAVLKFVSTLNISLGINSITHRYGLKPYDKNIPPADNEWFNILTIGDGHHNFHHAFPWDYTSAEMNPFLGNITGSFIRAMAAIGQAYDLKTVSTDVIQKRKLRTGDNSNLVKQNKNLLVAS